MSAEAGKTVSHSPFDSDKWRNQVKQYLIHHLIQMSEEASKTVSHSPFNSDEWRSQ